MSNSGKVSKRVGKKVGTPGNTPKFVGTPGNTSKFAEFVLDQIKPDIRQQSQWKKQDLVQAYRNYLEQERRDAVKRYQQDLENLAKTLPNPMNQIREGFLQLASINDSGFVITKESEIVRLLEPDLQGKILLIPTEYRPCLPESYRCWIRKNWGKKLHKIVPPDSDSQDDSGSQDDSRSHHDGFIHKTLKLFLESWNCREFDGSRIYEHSFTPFVKELLKALIVGFETFQIQIDTPYPATRETLPNNKSSYPKRPDITIATTDLFEILGQLTIVICEISGGPTGNDLDKKKKDCNKLHLMGKGSRDKMRLEIQRNHDDYIDQEINDLVNEVQTILIQTYGCHIKVSIYDEKYFPFGRVRVLLDYPLPLKPVSQKEFLLFCEQWYLARLQLLRTVNGFQDIYGRILKNRRLLNVTDEDKGDLTRNMLALEKFCDK